METIAEITNKAMDNTVQHILKPDILDEHYDIWYDAHSLSSKLSFDHYMVCAREQLREQFLHYHVGNMPKAMNEVVDMISLSLNLLYWFGLDKDGVRNIIIKRMTDRMKGRTFEIIEKYEKIRLEQDLALWD